MSELEEVEAIKAVAVAFEKLDEAARLRVLGWANAKYDGDYKPATEGKNEEKDPVRRREKKRTDDVSKGTKSAKRAKSIIKIDKSLDLNPSGKQSADAFAKEKSPTNGKQKGVVAAYYIREKLDKEKVTIEQVAAYFKGVGWPLPADLKNVLQQAGTEGWLDTADNQNILITSSGETLVEHKLPKTASKKK